MTRPNAIGTSAGGLWLFALAGMFLHGAVPIVAASVLLTQWAGIFMFLYAGIKGPRWWLLPPILLVAVVIWALTRGH